MKKKRIGKRLGALFLCLPMLLGNIPVHVSAAEMAEFQEILEEQEEIPAEEAMDEEIPEPETPVEETPIEETSDPEPPVEEGPDKEILTEEESSKETPVEGESVEEAPVEEEPAEKKPVEEEPVVAEPVEEEPVEEVLSEEVPAAETPTEEAPYFNYYFGDPAYDGNYIAGYDGDGEEIPELYCQDLDEIILMAEVGMDLSWFFRGTVFQGFSLEDLYAMREEEVSFDEAVSDYLRERDLPSWLEEALNRGEAAVPALMSLEEGTGADTLTASGVTRMSNSPLGVIPSLGSSKSHGYVVQLQTTGNDGASYPAFCASYGGSYRSGYTYSRTDYSECVSPNGSALSAYQNDLLTCVVNTYYKATDQQPLDYAAAQLVIWYIINNMPDRSVYFDPDEAWEQGGLKEAAVLIGGEGYAEFIRRTILSYSFYINMQWDGTLDLDHFSPVDNYPGEHVELQFWCSPVSNAQWIITWNAGGAAPVPDELAIPYIDNFYMEREAVAKYHVDITKESIITNELLEGISFEVVESEGEGSPLEYDIIRGTFAEDGSDYPYASVEAGSFGQTVPVPDTVPYMDNDVEPSGGQHRTMLTTDENGHASTTFVHEHTFKEFFSRCYAGPGQEVDHETYLAAWENILEKASKADDRGEALVVSYLGSRQEMDYEEIKEIHDSQQVVYTQTQEQARQTIDSMYQAYMARTYTYTVTEQDGYVRPSAGDSNGNTLAEISLPKKGYRMNVQDAVTVGPYVEIVENGGTMKAGGKNDQDPGTQGINVTNEPWYNQLFINKTDLESGSQILYDTEFQIYEYYQYRAGLTAASRKVYPGELLTRYLTEQDGKLRPENIQSATMRIKDSKGNEILAQSLDVKTLTASMKEMSLLSVEFTPPSAGNYQVILELTVDGATSLDTAISRTISDGRLEEEEAGVYLLMQRQTRERNASVDEDGTVWLEEGGMLTSSWDPATNITTYYHVDDQGTAHIWTSDGDGASLKVWMEDGTMKAVFSYQEWVFTGIRLFSADGGLSYRGQDEEHDYVSVQVDGDTYTLYYDTGETLPDGKYTCSADLSVSSAELSVNGIDRSNAADMDDYTTWGQDNYEIVRVTAEITKQMGWPDQTIGMYTVHRLSMTDQYTGTTFSDGVDQATGEPFGCYEYGTLYYTQANLGKFAIVETKAPGDGDRSGYLGNYEDRDYSGLDETSLQKNDEGAPYDTADSYSQEKMVHFVDLCADTNQYATYMLVDGYRDYDSVYYSKYAEFLDSEGKIPTEDGYDGDHYAQSGSRPSISLERYALSEPVHDILNRYWDEFFSQSLREKSGILVGRDSEKTDTYFGLVKKEDLPLNFVGTTINLDSFQNNDPAKSNLICHGSYTDTTINYHSYTKDAEELNARSGFHDTEYVQAGAVDYDNGVNEKLARFTHTQEAVGRDQGHAFIDERPYGFLRFSKYDAEAERYVKGDLSENYAAGTDHGDGSLDGAVYSLYVGEDQQFTVEYYAGSLEEKLFWAQPLKDGGFRLIWDGEDSDVGFTDCGHNEYTDYPHAAIRGGILYLDDRDEASENTAVSPSTRTYYGIRHPDGQYGGPKHNGFFAVLEEQQVFIDTDNDGFSDTWTLQDVTLEAGAKVLSAAIRDGEIQIHGLYLGNYYLAEEIRDAIVIASVNNDDQETREIKWLSFAAGYLADTDLSGNPTKYFYHFPYEDQKADGTVHEAEQVYVQKETGQYSPQEAIKGAGFQLQKLTTNGESASSGNTTGEALQGAGFTVYLISELSLIQDGTIAPAFSLAEGDRLVYENQLAALFDAAGNLSGYQFTRDYIARNEPFTEKYGADYDLEEVNRIVYVAGHGYYFMQDILDAYRNQYYSNDSGKWDLSGETRAIARMYENDGSAVEEINKEYQYMSNQLNHGNPNEWYGVNGISEGWTATGVRNEYRLSELFTNYKGNLRSPELPWGAYLVVETTTPADVFTVDPLFVTISDSSATANRSSEVSLSDASFVASLVLVKRDAQSGQDVLQDGISYRIWDYQNHRYVDRYLLGENGVLSMISQHIFQTDEQGRLNAVASLETGTYRLEELTGPEGFYNRYWDLGNPTRGETLGGIGGDQNRPTVDNLHLAYWGTVDFEVTTERRYQSSGIVSSGNLDYIYIGETCYNEEAVGKLNILKTGEVLVGYAGTDEIEYGDEYEDFISSEYNEQKAGGKTREVFEQIKEQYDLGTDQVIYRDKDGEKEAILDREDGTPGETFEFIYEERPLAGAVYEITAAEDIPTQDGGENYWFRKGDVAATVTTGADGEIVRYSPNYSTASNVGGGSYDYTYYYGEKDGMYDSLTGRKNYGPEAFVTTGAVENQWVESRMSELDQALYGIPAFTDETIYPNTFYREEETAIFRRLYRGSIKGELMASDYVTSLEEEGNLTSSTAGILTETPEGYRLSWPSVKDYPGSVLEPNGDRYLLRLADGNTIEAKASDRLYMVTEASEGPWTPGDMVEKTAAGYRLTHTDPCVAGEARGAGTEGAKDLGYTVEKVYGNASVTFDPEGVYTLHDADGNEIVKMQGGLLVTEFGGLLRETASGHEVSYLKYKDLTDNPYGKANLEIAGAVLTLNGAKYDLIWNPLHQNFVTTRGNRVETAPDHSYVTVTIGDKKTDYYAFDLVMEYRLHYGEKENIVTVENDGTLGTVSVTLPLGTYQVREIQAPYGFVLSHDVQTVEFSYGDQIKEVVFNTAEKSGRYTEETMKLWEAKGLSWFLGGLNTIGEKLKDISGVNFFTWGTYGDAELPYYGDPEGFLNFYDLRVKAWSEKETPDIPEIPEPTEPDGPEDHRHPESEENQKKLGVGIYKMDQETKEGLAGAKFGLYTRDNIYNADGKLLAEAGQLLMTAVTDPTGHANFAVDIPLMSRSEDKDAADLSLLYDSAASDAEERSIDGNTAGNSGAYYIQEITPPDGYLIDDRIHEVEFVYEDQYTMYIPVYGIHENAGTRVTLTKTDLTGTVEVPGAKISLYQIVDIHQVDEQGRISHGDDNLRLIDTWTSTEDPHVIEHLLLSNVEWPRLTNQEERENIYVFREELPADGYASAADMEWKLYQKKDENGAWLDENDSPYGWEVLVKEVTCDQEYESGTIIAASRNADDWIREGAEENHWDYGQMLDGVTLAKWRLVNGTLVVFFHEDATSGAVSKALKEKDFEELEFDRVHFVFAGDKFPVEGFYEEKVVDHFPADAELTYTAAWKIQESMDLFLYDDTTKIRISKRDLTTGEEVDGARLTLRQKDTGEIVDTWKTGEDGYDENGRPLEHHMEGILKAGTAYVLEETLAPTEDGYIKSNSVEFEVMDTGEIQHVIMEDDFTKLEISKADIATGEEVEGAVLELWSADAEGRKNTIVDIWTTGADGYDEEGRPNRHRIDYLVPGNYILSELLAPTDKGYVKSEDVAFTLTETGILQQVRMYDDVTKLDIYKLDSRTGEMVPGAVLELYALGSEFGPEKIGDTKELTVSEKDLVTVVHTSDQVSRVERLPAGWYAVREKKAPAGYILDQTPVIIQILDTSIVQYVKFYNQPSSPDSPGTPKSPSSPGPEIPEDQIDSSSWNNVRTEDTGQEGYSILLEVERSSWKQFLPYVAAVVGAILLAAGLMDLRMRREEKENEESEI